MRPDRLLGTQGELAGIRYLSSNFVHNNQLLMKASNVYEILYIRLYSPH